MFVVMMEVAVQRAFTISALTLLSLMVNAMPLKLEEIGIDLLRLMILTVADVQSLLFQKETPA